jgi:hypothetical protein
LLVSAGLTDNGSEMGIATDILYDLNGYDEYGIFGISTYPPPTCRLIYGLCLKLGGPQNRYIYILLQFVLPM